jgi:hypothetical protein
MQGWLENLYASMTTGSSVPLPLEQAVYAWMYADASSAWGHRHNLLTAMFTNGLASGQGLLGIGLASGRPYLGYPLGTVVVMDAINPCPGWVYGGPLTKRAFLAFLR